MMMLLVPADQHSDRFHDFAVQVGIWDSLVTYTSFFDPKTEKILPSIPPGATGLEANRLTLFHMEVSSND